MATKRKSPPTVARRTAKSGIPLSGHKRSAALESHTPQLPDAAKMAEFESARSARVRESGRAPAPKTTRRAVHLAAATDKEKRQNAQFGGASGDPWNVTSKDVAAAFNSGRYDLKDSRRDIAHAENVSSVLRSLIGQLDRNSTANPYMTDAEFKSGLQSAVTLLNAAPDSGETLLWLFVGAGEGSTIPDKVEYFKKARLAVNKRAAEKTATKPKELLTLMLKGYSDADLTGKKFDAVLEKLIAHFKHVAFSEFENSKWQGIFKFPARVKSSKEKGYDKAVVEKLEREHTALNVATCADRKKIRTEFKGKKFDGMSGADGFVANYFDVYLRQKVEAFGVSPARTDAPHPETTKIVGLNYSFEAWIDSHVLPAIIKKKNEIRPGTKK